MYKKETHSNTKEIGGCVKHWMDSAQDRDNLVYAVLKLQIQRAWRRLVN